MMKKILRDETWELVRNGRGYIFLVTVFNCVDSGALDWCVRSFDGCNNDSYQVIFFTDFPSAINAISLEWPLRRLYVSMQASESLHDQDFAIQLTALQTNGDWGTVAENILKTELE